MLENHDLYVDIVVGGSNPNRNELVAMISGIPNFSLHVNVGDMASLMESADLCIGAGGSTNWERCCLGLPCIIIALAENQVRIVDELAKEGCIVSAGWYEDISHVDLFRMVSDIVSNPSLLKTLSEKARALVDGEGAIRVAKRMCAVN